MTEPHGIARTGPDTIRIPFTLADDDLGIIADGMREIGPDDPRYADYDEWLTAIEADAAAAGDSWSVTGEVPDTGERVSITWQNGIKDCPPDALDWLIAAVDAGEVDGEDGAALLAWLETQGFTRQEGGSGG